MITVRADQLQPGDLLHDHTMKKDGPLRVTEVRPLERVGMNTTWTYVGLEGHNPGHQEFPNDTQVRVDRMYPVKEPEDLKGRTATVLLLPHRVALAHDPETGEPTEEHVLNTGEQINVTCRALHRALSVLEEIAAFDRGQAGDRACEVLKDLGVWSKNVQRIDGSPMPPGLEDVHFYRSTKIEFDYVNWRDEQHHYVVVVEGVRWGHYRNDSGNGPCFLMDARFVSRDGDKREDIKGSERRRTFILENMQNVARTNGSN